MRVFLHAQQRAAEEFIPICVAQSHPQPGVPGGPQDFRMTSTSAKRFITIPFQRRGSVSPRYCVRMHEVEFPSAGTHPRIRQAHLPGAARVLSSVRCAGRYLRFLSAWNNSTRSGRPPSRPTKTTPRSFKPWNGGPPRTSPCCSMTWARPRSTKKARYRRLCRRGTWRCAPPNACTWTATPPTPCSSSLKTTC